MKTRFCLVGPCCVLGFALLLLALPAALPAAESRSDKRPNILVILADDMGFSDLGCYGSEIETPHLDRLAAGGLRLTQFYNTAKCHSSRISLLSGRYPYQAGNRKLHRSVTFAEVLRASGYFTAMAGKWHLDREPTDFGFSRFFGHLSGSCNYFLGDRSFRLNGEPWQVPAQGFYTTVANVDFGLQFIAEARAEKKPWALYLAFNAPHTPLQPLEQDYKKYLGRYEGGWDVLREARVQKQTQLGLFGKHVTPCPRPDHVPAWDSLSPARRDWESKRMAAYAALIDRLDRELGRLLDNLRTAGELENTFILFLSDNGANPFDRHGAEKPEPFASDTGLNLGTGWAWMANSPFRLYKQNQFEGGIATPAIIHWPAGTEVQPGSLSHVPAHLVDVLPTLADVAGAPIPAGWPERELAPLAGVSLGPILAGGNLPPRPLYFLYDDDRALREGDWKLVSYKGNPWELYNLAEDRTEQRDLASQQPAIRDRLAKLWFEMAVEVDSAPRGRRSPVLETAMPVFSPGWTSFDSAQEKGPHKRSGKARSPIPAEATTPAAP